MGFLDFQLSEDVYASLAKLQGGLAHGSITGKTFFLDNSDSDASDVTGGGTFFQPFNTLSFAISECVSGRGDVILVKPGHDETISGTVTINVTTVSIIGLGHGKRFRPRFQFDNTAGEIRTTVAGVRLQSLRFMSTVSGHVNVLDIATASHGFTLIGCFFQVEAAADDVTNAIVVAASVTDVHIAGNRIEYLEATSGSTTALALGGANTRLRVVDNYIAGDFSTAAISMTSTATDDLEITHNRIYNAQTANVDGAIDIVASSRGVIAYNVGFHGYATALTSCIDPANCAQSENYFNNVAGEAGGLVGTPST